MNDQDVDETFSDRFLDVVLEKGLLWLLGGVLVLLAAVVTVQIVLVLS